MEVKDMEDALEKQGYRVVPATTPGPVDNNYPPHI